jgi:response regulator RpfG family c-di-GMP phosphodiesterase
MAEGNVFVIDDELVVCELLSDLLKDRGYSVKYALSGEEGVREAKGNRFDVIMTDLRLPDMDGIKVLEAIRTFDPDSVVIIITGYPSFETVQAALRQGAYDYITKPFNIEEISFVIKRAVAFKNLAMENKRLMKELGEHNIKLEEVVKERTQELTILYRIGRDMSSTLKLDAVLEIIVDRLSKILDSEICSILLLDPQTKELSIGYAGGLGKEIVRDTKMQMGESISGWVAEHKEAVLVEDIELDPRFAKKNQEKYYTHSLISVPLLVKGEVIGVININNKKSKTPFTKDDFRFAKGIAAEAAIALENAKLYTTLEDSYIRTVVALTSAIDAKDHYTKNHSEHVCRYAVAIANELGIAQKEMGDLKNACHLHDLGKIGIPDYILTKPDKLNAEEWEEMKLHSLKSAEILRPLIFLNGVIEIVEQHHERYDGKGYPYGVKGEQINLGARIMAVADSFDAMVTDRPYRKAFTKEDAIAELKKCSGTQFDPKVVEAFLKAIEKNTDMLCY